MRNVAILMVALSDVACTGAAPQQTAAPTDVPTTLASTTHALTARPRPTPETATHRPAAGPFDGVWATEALTQAEFEAPVVNDGLDPADMYEWFRDWSGISYRLIQSKIGNGRFVNVEYADGIQTSGFDAPMELIDVDILRLTDEEADCGTDLKAARTGDELIFEVLADDCPNDLETTKAMFESSVFHLVQEPTYAVPEATPGPSGPAPTRAPSTSNDRQTAHPIGTVEGAELGYLEYLPPDYGAAPAPLLVALHGSGDSGDGTEYDLAKLVGGGIPQLIQGSYWPDDRPFVVLSPQHEEDPPAWCFTADEIDSFLKFALKHYDVDPSRVYVTGLSCGAIGLWNYLAQFGGEKIAAAIPIAGHGLVAADTQGCDLGNTPIWAFHGEHDEAVALVGDVYPLTMLQSCTDPAALDARLTVFPRSGHDVWSRVYGNTSGHDIYEWMLSHTR